MKEKVIYCVTDTLIKHVVEVDNAEVIGAWFKWGMTWNAFCFLLFIEEMLIFWYILIEFNEVHDDICLLHMQ